jgi:hypothetical protein
MKIQKIIKTQGTFAKKGEDINPNDVVTIKSEGEWVEGQFGQQFVVKIEKDGKEYNVNFNQTTINILHDEFGDDTTKWIDKEVTIRAKKDVVAGKKVDIYYFVTPEWDFDEYRELVKPTDIPIID